MTDSARVRPVRLQLSRRKGFDLQALSLATNGLPAVNVARPSKWGNPFPVSIGLELAIKMYGELIDGYFNPFHLKRLTDVEFAPIYAAKMRWQEINRHPTHAIKCELAGKNLACFCKPGDPCHADVLLALANPGPGKGEG